MSIKSKLLFAKTEGTVTRMLIRRNELLMAGKERRLYNNGEEIIPPGGIGAEDFKERRRNYNE